MVNILRGKKVPIAPISDERDFENKNIGRMTLTREKSSLSISIADKFEEDSKTVVVPDNSMYGSIHLLKSSVARQI